MLARAWSRFVTHRLHEIPVLVLMPHSRCNCRCVMCDIWKANQTKNEISPEELSRHIDQFVKWKVKEVLLSGGEPLMHANLWALTSLLRKEGMRISMLSTGLLLSRHATDIVANVDEVIVSLDGTRDTHNRIRNIPQAYEKLAEGVSALKQADPSFLVTARCVLQKQNFSELKSIVDAAHEISLDQISFLAADTSSAAFNRDVPWTASHVSDIALNKDEAILLEEVIRDSFVSRRSDYSSGFIAEHPRKMLRIAEYYKATNELAEFVAPPCNAPWASVVIESDGRVMPCFFHKAYGTIDGKSLEDVVNSPSARQFRRKLNVKNDPVCKKCVCSLKIRLS